MKFNLKSVLTVAIIAVVMVSCGEDTEIENTNASTALDLVGTVEYRTASKEELKNIQKPTNNKANCTLDGDTGCSDGAASEFERYVRECTTYPRIWPPTGAVVIKYKSMVYYVDGDSDINLDHYQDDLQAHVSTLGTAAFIDADIVYWQCNDREQNSCVIKYTVYK
ncbi:hypothetical protein ABW636_22395 [Aquimarina sp. 2201CG1-2-11]|uniref:hypothetical protein n=1 Tax=Aquimarina discodermiae TaxID=3231043 RepID=UPI003461A141